MKLKCQQPFSFVNGDCLSVFPSVGSGIKHHNSMMSKIYLNEIISRLLGSASRHFSGHRAFGCRELCGGRPTEQPVGCSVGGTK